MKYDVRLRRMKYDVRMSNHTTPLKEHAVQPRTRTLALVSGPK